MVYYIIKKVDGWVWQNVYVIMRINEKWISRQTPIWLQVYNFWVLNRYLQILPQMTNSTLFSTQLEQDSKELIPRSLNKMLLKRQVKLFKAFNCLNLYNNLSICVCMFECYLLPHLWSDLNFKGTYGILGSRGRF